MEGINKDPRLSKNPQDPIITKPGLFLRRWSIDEIPQLINVLKGEMSLVGPRPPLVEEVTKYEHSEKRRLLVKPGLTGLWQVSGRSELDWEDAVRLDLYYIENWSLTLDLLIIIRTFAAVLRGEGAY
jgi:lipopolysaccharide/colanic/teichoic acid biosynthesis glycosyltransferase